MLRFAMGICSVMTLPTSWSIWTSRPSIPLRPPGPPRPRTNCHGLQGGAGVHRPRIGSAHRKRGGSHPDHPLDSHNVSDQRYCPPSPRSMATTEQSTHIRPTHVSPEFPQYFYNWQTYCHICESQKLSKMGGKAEGCQRVGKKTKFHTLTGLTIIKFYIISGITVNKFHINTRLTAIKSHIIGITILACLWT